MSVREIAEILDNTKDFLTAREIHSRLKIDINFKNVCKNINRLVKRTEYEGTIKQIYDGRIVRYVPAYRKTIVVEVKNDE